MFYMTGVMKCIIAPLFASMVFAGLMVSPWLRDMGIWDVTIIFGAMSIAAGIAYGVFFHFTHGLIRALGFIAVMAYIFGMAIVNGKGLCDWPLPNGAVFTFDVFWFPFGFLFFGFIVWVCLYPREVLSISGAAISGVATEALREVDRKRR